MFNGEIKVNLQGARTTAFSWVSNTANMDWLWELQLDELPCVLLLASHVWGIWVMSYAKNPKDVAYRTTEGNQGFTNLLFVALHACQTLGWRAALLLWALSAAISWAFEHVGVATGAVYGTYHYPRDRLPWSAMAFLGHVPVGIPLTWITLFYPAYAVSNAAAGLGAAGDAGHGLELGRAVFLAAVDGVVVTMLDLAIDPIFSHDSVQYWVWSPKGDKRWFGVPFRNYGGWAATGFSVFALFRIVDGTGALGWPAKTAHEPHSFAFGVLPVLFYITEALFYAVNPRMPDGKPLPKDLEPLRIVAVFTSVFFSLFALGQLLST